MLFYMYVYYCSDALAAAAIAINADSIVVIVVPHLPRTEAVYLADQQSQENTTPNAMVSKSIDQGVEAEVFEAMPNEAREFLVKFHNSVDDRRELMEQMKLVKKARSQGE